MTYVQHKTRYTYHIINTPSLERGVTLCGKPLRFFDDVVNSAGITPAMVCINCLEKSSTNGRRWY